MFLASFTPQQVGRRHGTAATIHQAHRRQFGHNEIG